MKIIFLAHLFPLPQDSGGKIKSYHTLRALSERHETHVISFLRTRDEADRAPELESMCASVCAVPLVRGRLRYLSDAALSLAARRSFIVSRDFRREMARLVQERVERIRPDVIHIDHLQMAQFVDFDSAPKTVLDQHNVESTIIRRIAQTSPSQGMRLYARLEWPKLRAYELWACRKASLVTTVSDEDRIALQAMDPQLTHVHTVPIGVDTDYFRPVERSAGSVNILSIGTMHWPPNVESMLYFYKEILPLVRRQIPQCTLTIAGQQPVAAIRALAADPVVRVTGYVSDAREVARDCAVFVVPLLSGSGVRVKILNAMAMGLPIVSTSVGAEGLDARPGTAMLIADTPDGFARAVVEVMKRRDLADRLGREGRALVCEKYSWKIVGERLLALYDERLAA